MNNVKRVRIGDAFDVETGSTPSTAIPEYWEDGKIKWITPFDLGRLSSTRIYETSRNITQKGLDNSSAKLVPADSIIISTRAPIGYLAVLAEPMAFNQGCKALLPKEANSVEPVFVFYQLKTKIEEMNRLGSGSTFKEISKEKLESIELQLPPLSKQKQVSAILVKADSALEKRRQANQLTEQFLQSAFLQMFGDPVTNPRGWRKLTGEDYCEKLTVGVVIRPASHYVDIGVIALRSVNIRPNRIDLSDLVYFSKEAHKNELAKSALRSGDVVIVRTGSTGTAAIIPQELDGCNCIDLIITRPRENLIHPAYLCYFFNSQFGKNVVSAKEVGGIQKHFNIGALRTLGIPVPPFSIQRKFTALVQKVDSLRAKQKESEKELENLFNSLMQKAFNGELVS